ncbi:uncharacterized protein M6B38_293820 [Iris pallida]|uniref:Uncharacterized protein n=1 Tax=Iris pallida TaxID=29817 RepID=A0AAX6HWB2_IRIPA|nr:uncharacterized protein M6B38_293820 [Iris pallida]
MKREKGTGEMEKRDSPRCRRDVIRRRGAAREFDFSVAAVGRRVWRLNGAASGGVRVPARPGGVVRQLQPWSGELAVLRWRGASSARSGQRGFRGPALVRREGGGRVHHRDGSGQTATCLVPGRSTGPDLGREDRGAGVLKVAAADHGSQETARSR